MTINLIHVSDIHFGSGETHGKINAATGLNIRLEDFVHAFEKVVDYALKQQIDVFLFSGDAYRNATPEPIYQKLFATQLKRLSKAGIATVLLVGNHDQILKSTSSHSLSVFQSLEVPGITTIDRPMSIRLDTKNGALQLIGIPHVTRHQIMTYEKYSELPTASIDRVLTEHIDALLKGYYQDLDPSLPTVITAHMTVDRALAGIEQELLVGYTLTFPAEIFVDPKIDYVALGHVHKHQVIRESNPLIVYAGSLERIDFGEQKEDKGFVHVQLNRNHATYEFHSISPRPFITIDADLIAKANPTEHLCKLIKQSLVPGCVLRVRYRLHQEQLHAIDESLLIQAAAQALSIRLQPEIVMTESRARLPELSRASESSPLAALDTYLSEVAPERKDGLLEKARNIMSQLDIESI